MQERPRTRLRQQAQKIRKEQKQEKKALKLSPDAATAWLCKRYLSEFVKEFWDVVIKQPMQWNWHMDVLCDEVQKVYEWAFMKYDEDGNAIGRSPKQYDLLINVPPGSSKSTIASQMAQAWGWYNDPTLKYICGSYNMKLTLNHADKCKLIVSSEKYKLYYRITHTKKDAKGNITYSDFALRSDRNSLSEYHTVYGGMRYSTSVGAGITGVHGDVNTVDDPLNVEPTGFSINDIETANGWVNNTLESRQANKDKTITVMIMQRVASDDPSGYWLQMLKDDKEGNIKIKHLCLPAILSDNVSPKELAANYVDGLLDPIRMSHQILATKKAKMGSMEFAGQFQQRPTPKGGLIWQKWFIEVPDEVFPDARLMTGVSTDWDLAYTKNDENAASAWVTTGRIGNRYYLIDFGFVYFEFPEVVKLIKTKPAPHYIEAKASGKSAKQVLVRQDITAIEVQVNSDKISRAKEATPDVECGKWYIPKSLADRLYSHHEQGILFFPKGAKADLADVLAQAIIRQGRTASLHVADPGTHDVDVLDY